MAKTLTLKAQLREHTGSKAARLVRKQDRIPAIVYGHKKDPVSVSLDRHDFTEGVHHGHRLLEVQVDGKKETVIIKDIQYDHLGRQIIHADLVRVSAAERVTVAVPIELKGTAAGAEEGGIVEAHLDHLDVECKVTEIPDKITVSVREMNVGDTIHASDIELPPDVKLVTDPEALMVACHIVTAAPTAEEAEEEEPAAPEVIGEEEEKPEAEQAEGEKESE